MTTRRLLPRADGQDGFGLVELVAAMVLLSIGILAVAASFTSGVLSLKHASHTTTAATLADRQLELYRSLHYADILLDSTQMASVDSTYTGDYAYSEGGTVTQITGTCALSGGAAVACEPMQTGIVGPDHSMYRIDSYVVADTVSTSGGTSGQAMKKVTVVVRDGTTTGTTLARVQTVFDSGTG